MDAAAIRLEFAPPPSAASPRALGLAVLAHLLLLAALTWGVNWKRDAVTVATEAELWSAVPQQAAPLPVEPPVLLPQPSLQSIRPPAPDALPNADIVTAREKRRLENLERLEDEKRADAKKLQDDKKKAAAKLAEAQQKQAELKQAELAAKRKEALLAQDEAQKREAQRQENIKRMAGLAGSAGTAGATGTAQQSSGPSAGYAGRLRAIIRRNTVFTEDIAGNPTAEVEVRTAPDGTIISRKLVKASGVASWDEAVLKAIDKTEVLPRDVDGRVPGSLVISSRPKD